MFKTFALAELTLDQFAASSSPRARTSVRAVHPLIHDAAAGGVR